MNAWSTSREYQTSRYDMTFEVLGVIILAENANPKTNWEVQNHWGNVLSNDSMIPADVM